MPRQIEDDEYNYLQQRRQVADFVEGIYNDPALSKEAKALIKKKYPNLQIPDYDIEAKLEARLDAERAEREKEEQKKREAAEDEEFKRRRKKVQDDYGFTPEAMERLEKLMVERNVGDYEIAAQFMASREPKTSEPTFDSSRWHHEREDGFADIAKDPEAWARDQFMGAIDRDAQNARGGR